MYNKRIVTTLLILSLLAVLTTTAYATGSYHPAAPSIVGTWNTIIPHSEGNPQFPTFESMLTFTADGNMIETNSNNPTQTVPAHGVWIGSGSNYLMMFEGFSFDEHSKHIGKVQAHVTIKMDSTDHFTGTYTLDIIDLDGKATKKVAYGTLKATRMEVELP